MLRKINCTFIGLFISLSLLSFRPGEPVATLTCKTIGGAIVFEAVLPQCKYLEKATYHAKNQIVDYAMTDKSAIVFKPEKKIFTLGISSASKEEVKLIADPITFKLIKNKKGPGTEFQKVYTFDAMFNYSAGTKPVKLKCVLDYEL